MTLSPHSRELLEFMYALTKKQEFLTPSAAADYFRSVTGAGTSARTVMRWFKYLSRFGFGYYPYVNYSSMNLIVASVLLPENEAQVGDSLPNKFYVFKGVSFSDFKKYSLFFYALPPDKINVFSSFWSNAQSSGAVSYVRIYYWTRLAEFYAPFHQVIRSNGDIQFPDEGVNNDYFLGLLKSKLDSPAKVQMHKLVAQQPLAIPIMLEYAREHWSAQKVWLAMRERLGENIWRYVRHKRSRSDGLGIKLTQSVFKELQGRFGDFFQQMRVQHDSFYSDRCVSAYLFLTLRRPEIYSLARDLAARCLVLDIYLPLADHRQLMLFLSTSNKEHLRIIRDILPRYAAEGENKLVYLDHEQTDYYWCNYRKYLKINYAETFNLEKLGWEYSIPAGCAPRRETILP